MRTYHKADFADRAGLQFGRYQTGRRKGAPETLTARRRAEQQTSALPVRRSLQARCSKWSLPKAQAEFASRFSRCPLQPWSDAPVLRRLIGTASIDWTDQ